MNCEKERKQKKEKASAEKKGTWVIFLSSFIILLVGFSYLIVVLTRYFNTAFLIFLMILMMGISLVLWLIWRKWNRAGLLLLLLFIFFLLAGILVIGNADSMAREVTRTTEYEIVQIAVIADSYIKISDDFSQYKLGYNRNDSQARVRGEEILQEKNRPAGEMVAYSDTKSMYSALKRGNIDLMVLTSDTRSDLSMIDENYETRVRILFEKRYPLEASTGRPVDITEEPFTLYLCGVDLSAGQDITSTGRGDVNLLLTVNPKTEEVYMQAVPRDTFVYIPCRNGSSKLSYSGWWGGVSSSIAIIEEKFDIEINYYAKINFSGLTDLVDGLGGITVYSHYNFSYNGYDFVKGENRVDGEKALQFVRARKMLPKNELSRGIHQMELIRGIFEKFYENPDYRKATAVMKAISENFTTNLREKDFYPAYQLVRRLLPQLTEMEMHSMEGRYQWHYDEIRKGYYQYYFYPEEEDIIRVREEIRRLKTAI